MVSPCIGMYKRMIAVPNIVSMTRIFVTPLLVILLLNPDSSLFSSTPIIFFLAIMTDLLDGYLARTYYSPSHTGAFLDPLADKILLVSLFATFAYLKVIPLWMILCIATREGGMTLLRMAVKAFDFRLQTSGLGKSKTCVQSVALFIMILLYATKGDINALGHYSSYISAMMWAVVVITLVSALDYITQIFLTIYRRNRAL